MELVAIMKFYKNKFLLHFLLMSILVILKNVFSFYRDYRIEIAKIQIKIKLSNYFNSRHRKF